MRFSRSFPQRLSDWQDKTRALLGRRLEEGVAPNPLFLAACRVWEIASARALMRRFQNTSPIPSNCSGANPPVLAVVGAVLGGAGKTPLAIALARELASARGKKIVLVSHAYRASPGYARAVQWGDDPLEVGDDALASARALRGDGVAVITAPHREAALKRALSLKPDVIVSDGHPAPVRAGSGIPCETVLTLDASLPVGRCPPLGDLRAPLDALVACSTHCAVLCDPLLLPSALSSIPRGAVPLDNQIIGAVDSQGMHFNLEYLKSFRIGLILGVARPNRIVFGLRARGIDPEPLLLFGDHARFSVAHLEEEYHRYRRPFKENNNTPELWLTTARCAPKLPPALWGAPVLALSHRIDARPLLEHIGAVR